MTENSPKVDCTAAMQQLWDYVDGELTPERMFAVKRHLAECSHCVPHAEFAERFLAALHETREVRCCSKDLRTRVVARLREAGLDIA